MDADYELKQRCEESAQEVFDEGVGLILIGGSIRYIEDLLSEASDNCVPIYTKQRWDLVEHLDEHWDEAKEMKTLDDALGYAIYMAASDHIHCKWNELGGSDKLEELESLFSDYKGILESDDEDKGTQLEAFFKDNADDAKTLKLELIPKNLPAPTAGPKAGPKL